MVYAVKGCSTRGIIASGLSRAGSLGFYLQHVSAYLASRANGMQRNMKWITCHTGSIALAIGLFMAGCRPVAPPPAPSVKPPPRGEPVSRDMTLPSLAPDGGAVAFSEWQGRVMLVDFWATWSEPCVRRVPELNALQQEFADRGFTVIGLALDRGELDDVKTAVAKLSPAYPVARATEAVQAAYGGVRAIPTAYLVDADGMVVTQFTGAVSADTLRDGVAQLLGP